MESAPRYMLSPVSTYRYSCSVICGPMLVYTLFLHCDMWSRVVYKWTRGVSRRSIAGV
jgi:hypothetical protein